MANLIRADNGVSSGVTGIVQTADSSGQLALQTTTAGGAATTALTIDNNQNTTIPASKNLYFNYASGYSPRLSNSASNDSLSVFTNNVEAIRVNASGNLAFQVSNAGIVFDNSSATTNSLLNDYETGTFTPILSRFTTSPSVSYAHQEGIYTKIGNQVFVQGYIQWNTNTGGSGNFIVNNLPFTAANITYNNPQFTTTDISNITFPSSTYVVGLEMNTNTTFANFSFYGPSANSVYSTSCCGGTGSIVFSGFYQATF